MAEAILVEITIEGKKSTITITAKGVCEIDENLDLKKLSALVSLIGAKSTEIRMQKIYYQDLFGSTENERI